MHLCNKNFLPKQGKDSCAKKNIPAVKEINVLSMYKENIFLVAEHISGSVGLRLSHLCRVHA